MGIKKIPIEQFITLAAMHPVLDVRSPGEYNHAHINGAYSLPLFTDEERAIVGTAYKQQGKQKAIKLGLEFFGVKMKSMVDEAERLVKSHFKEKKDTASSNTLLVHCWRGGMRSAGVAWLLELYGFDVYTLVGGYKAYRKWALQQLQIDYDIRILGGYTGSGKTELLQEMQQKGHLIIDLEGIAQHKGSAFGGIGMPPQPSQEMFENLLAESFFNINGTGPENCKPAIWLEDESQRIGVLNIPHTLWNIMRSKPVFFIDIPFDERLKNIVETYGKLDKEKIINAVTRIQKRLGPLETKTTLGFLMEDNLTEAFRILLAYYDKTYGKSLTNRNNIDQLLNKISLDSVDTIINTEKLLSCTIVNS